MAKEKSYTRRSESAAIHSTSEKISSPYSGSTELVFGRNNYKFILIGLGLIFLGLALMSGGHMPSPDVWDESLIYSWRRITLAPMVIIAGLLVNVYAIFVKK
jgi:hypothetical protein